MIECKKCRDYTEGKRPLCQACVEYSEESVSVYVSSVAECPVCDHEYHRNGDRSGETVQCKKCKSHFKLGHAL